MSQLLKPPREPRDDGVRFEEKEAPVVKEGPVTATSKPTRKKRSTKEQHLLKLVGQTFGQTPTMDEVLGGAYAETLDQHAAKAVWAKLAEGTRSGYSTGWTQWARFRELQGESAFLEGESPKERRQEEDALLRYTAFLHLIMKRSEGTIRQKLFAIKFGHTVAGLPDPLQRRDRLWAALAGYARWQGAPLRRLPVTVENLEWLREYFAEFLDMDVVDRATVWAAINTGWHFLLRSSEYLPNPGALLSKVMLGTDVVPRRDGKAVRWFSSADEVMIHIKGSKTDQYNVGTVRNHFATSGPLCIVGAFRELERLAPGRFRREEPLFRYKDGSPVLREHVQHYLRLAAVGCGGDPDRMGSHSLRIGGASALYHATQDMAYVQRFGRWASEAYHCYLWETHELTRGMAQKMQQGRGILTRPKLEHGASSGG